MISLNAQQVAAHIHTHAQNSITSIFNQVREEDLLFIAAQIVNSEKWIPADVSKAYLRQRLERLLAEMPERFHPPLFPND